MKKPNLKEIKNNAGVIFTSIIVLLLVCYLFVGVGIKSRLDDQFWTIFLIGFVIMIAINTIWYPIAKQKEEMVNCDYKNNRLEYSLLVNRVRDTNNFDGLKRFCEKATEENKLEGIKNKLSKYNIDFKLYQDCCVDINKIDTLDNLDKKQKQVLRKMVVNGLSTRFLWMRICGYEKINHTSITSAIDNIESPYTVKNDEKRFDARTWTAKILTSILCTFGIAMIAFDGKGFDLGKLAQIMTWIFVMAWNIFGAMNNGRKAVAVYRVQYYKKLRGFLEEFCASEYYDNSIAWVRPNLVDKSEN